MSYGAFVQACLDERRREISGVVPFDWQHQAEKLAASWAPDYPEPRFVEVLRELRWPTRRVTCSEVRDELKRSVPPAERRAWLAELDGAA